jgi:hypothetical protein
MFGKKQCPLPAAGWAEVETFAGKRTEIVVAAFRIGASDSCNPFEIVSTCCETLTESPDSLQAEHPVGFRILLVIEVTEIYKMAFEYFVKLVAAARDILFRRRYHSGYRRGHIDYYGERDGFD